MKKICLYHKNCMDGFAAAYAVWKKDPSYEFVPINYGEDLPDLEGVSELLMVDFSLSREKILELMKKMKVVVIDHHKTAEKELSGIQLKGDSDIVFCQDMSGAVLSWMYFHGRVRSDGIKFDTFNSESVPLLLQYVQDRDLWNWELADSEAVNIFLFSDVDFQETSFQEFDHLVRRFENNQDPFIIAGRQMLKYRDRLVNQICQSSEVVPFVISGEKYEVPVANSKILQSEVGNKLCGGYPFAVVWSENSKNRIFSLRSDSNGLDVGELCKKVGGGGHKHAAGFSKKI